jgi:hypothetical protein
MQRASVPTVRLIALLISLTAQAACTPSDYADGITAFSTAVDKANSAEQALIATYQQNTLDQTAAQVAGGNLSYGRPDLVKCRGNPGPYHAGDCVVQFGGQAAPVTAGPSSLASLTKYAELLSSVVTDKTCDTLDTDAKGLATSIGDIANDARNPSLAVPAAALATIVSAIGCGVIETAQLKILRTATETADPIVATLTPIVVDKDSRLQGTAIDGTIAQLSAAESRYDGSRSAADLKQVVSLTHAIDQAHLAPPGPVIQKLADLHHTLTEDLQSPTVTLTRVQSDAKALIAVAGSVETAAITLANPKSTVTKSGN